MSSSDRLFALAVIALVAGCGRKEQPPAQPTYSPEVESRIDAVVRGLPGGDLAARMGRDGVPGVSVAVVNGGAIEWARGFGVKADSSREPVDAGTLFQAASLSKPVAAAGALALAQSRQLALDGDVNQQLVAWRLPENGFTAAAKVVPRHLLSHTGGLTVSGFLGYEAGAPLPTITQILDGQPPANSAPVRVFRIPATRYDYSGGGYVILQLLMEERAGMPFAELMEVLVLGPLGMSQSTYAQPLPDALRPSAATGHRSGARPLPGASAGTGWHVYPERAAAGLWTTASDLARFVIEVAKAYAGTSDRLLTQEFARAMLTPVAESYGLGLGVFPRGGGAVLFSHDGANEGYRAVMYGVTGVEQGVVVLTNSDEGSPLARDVADSVARVYGWPR